MPFSFNKTDLSDAFLIDCFWAPDDRGGFVKFFERSIYEQNGIHFQVAEIFSTVNKKNVIRAMHFQRPTWQAKIVTVLHGAIFDVIVDLRKNSPTYLKSYKGGIEISASDRKAIYVPKGFAHGYLVREEGTVVTYICDERFVASDDTGIRFDDDTLGIKWPIDPQDAIISEKDRNLPFFDETIHSC